MTTFMTYKEECESLRRELENERARDIHSCGPDCTRSGCVNRRLREELAEAQQEIADCETGHDQDEATIAELRQQLAASQAREQQLREATECLLHLCEIIDAPDGPVLDKARQAIALPGVTLDDLKGGA